MPMHYHAAKIGSKRDTEATRLRRKTMRSFILTGVLSLGALGLLGALPTEAKAFPPQMYMNSFRVGPYAATTMYTNPYLNYYSRPYGAGVTYASPAVMQSYTNPSGFGAMYASRS